MAKFDEPFNPSSIAPLATFDNLPDIPAIQQLKGRKQWVAWRYEYKPDRPKPTKPPVQPFTGRGASHSDPKDWGEYDDAVTRVIRSGLEGVGYVLSPDDDLTGGDLDHCRDAETGELEPWAAEIVSLRETYIEISPSGEGLRIMWLGKVSETVKCDPAGIEIYGSKRYLTITGWHLEGTPPEIRPAPLTEAKLRERVAKFRPSEPAIKEGDNDFWRRVNTAALANLGDWVPSLFPPAKFQKGTGAYRVSAKQLGDGWEEDLSIAPNGIVYFGPADMGDARRGKRTPIDLVNEFGGKDPIEAAHWLCDRMGRSPAFFGWRDNEKKVAELANKFLASTIKAPDKFDATPWSYVDPSSLSVRQWLYGKHYIRRFVTATISPGGIGKTSLVMAEAVAMVTGRSLLGVAPDELSRVWFWNGEDPVEELQKRILATCQHYGIDQKELAGLFIDSGRRREIVIAEETKGGARISAPVYDNVVDAILRNKIDVFIVDPFVSSHRVNENDNNSIDLVAKAWATIADRTNCSIELVHHARKTGGQEVTVEHARGAVALISASRSARTLNGMSEDEEAKAGRAALKGVRQQFFRIDNGKANLALPPNRSTWVKMHSVKLPNGTGGLIDNGDEIGVPTLWEWPNAFEGVTDEQFRKAMDIIGTKPLWRDNPQSPAWVGHAIGGIFGVVSSDKDGKAKLATIIKAWMTNGALKITQAEDEARRMRNWIVVSG